MTRREKVARAICAIRGGNPDTCVVGSAGTGSMPNVCHQRAWELYTGDATAAIEAVRQAAAEDGWRMVPDEASPDMYDVGEAVLDNKGHIGDAYRAMLADPTAQFELDK